MVIRKHPQKPSTKKLNEKLWKPKTSGRRFCTSPLPYLRPSPPPWAQPRAWGTDSKEQRHPPMECRLFFPESRNTKTQPATRNFATYINTTFRGYANTAPSVLGYAEACSRIPAGGRFSIPRELRKEPAGQAPGRQAPTSTEGRRTGRWRVNFSPRIAQINTD